MREVEEIVERVEKIHPPELPIGWQIEVLLNYLPYEKAKQFINEENSTAEEEWDPIKPSTENAFEGVEQTIKAGYEAAEFHKGMAVAKIAQHLAAHMWVANDSRIEPFMDRHEPERAVPFGVPLFKIVEEFLVKTDKTDRMDPIPKSTQLNRMAEGKPCEEDCQICTNAKGVGAGPEIQTP